MADLLVYAVGDSVMWGEGLADENKFANRVAHSLARARGLSPRLRMLAHCGAKIKAARHEEDARRERQEFSDRYPHLFNTDTERRFLDSTPPNESPSARMFGEIPRAFPTIPFQLHTISDKDGKEVDVLLINGGANDLDFEAVFQTEDFLKLDDEYRRIFYGEIIELLTLARRKCPNALIVLTGYYSAFSLFSRFNEMKELFLWFAERENSYKFLSFARTVSFTLGWFTLGFFLDKLWSDANDDIEDAVSLARAASESGEARGTYWMRKAVTDINENPTHAGIRGPGIAFASPGFRPENAMFPPVAITSFIWERHDELNDDQRDVRAANTPRNDLRDEMEKFQRTLLQTALPEDQVQEFLQLKGLDGPLSLRTKILELLEDTADTNKRSEVAKLVKEEMDRIDIHRVSSLFHPNREGAARYTSVVHKRAEELRETSVRERLLAFLPPEQRQSPPAVLEVRKTIRQFRFDPATGLKACLAHAEPDVLGLVVRTHETSAFFSHEVFLNLGAARKWKLRELLMQDLQGDIELNPHFRPNTTDFFSIDVAGQIRIGDITRFVIEIAEEIDPPWLPEKLTFSIDGKDVLLRTFLSPATKVSHSMALKFPGTETPDIDD